jgi:hypothetical protein
VRAFHAHWHAKRRSIVLVALLASARKKDAGVTIPASDEILSQFHAD